MGKINDPINWDLRSIDWIPQIIVCNDPINLVYIGIDWTIQKIVEEHFDSSYLTG